MTPGEEYTFANTSWGAIHAFAQLCRDFLRGRDGDHPDPKEWPIVEVATTKRISPKYGSIVEPRFPIVDWDTLSNIKAYANSRQIADQSEMPENKAAKNALNAAKAKAAGKSKK